MKKYTVLKPMITSEIKLLINGDIIYTDDNLRVFCSKTRNYLGQLLNEDNLKLEKDYEK